MRVRSEVRVLRLMMFCLLVSLPTVAFGDPPPFHAGVARPGVAAQSPFEMLVWYPTETDTGVTMPVLIFRPRQSELPGEANAIGLASALPHAAQFESIPGSHFVFTDACPAALQAEASEACRDPPGVDRAAIHEIIEMKLRAFFGAARVAGAEPRCRWSGTSARVATRRPPRAPPASASPPEPGPPRARSAR